MVIFSEVTNSIGIALGFTEDHVLFVQVATKIILTYTYSARNTTRKESYSGRYLLVINTGDYKPLKEKCTCSETEI